MTVLMFHFGTNNILGTSCEDKQKVEKNEHAQFFQLQGMKYHMGFPDQRYKATIYSWTEIIYCQIGHTHTVAKSRAEDS